MQIIYLFLGSGLGANVGGGRMTQRFSALNEDARESEIQQAFEDAMVKIQNVSIDRLITAEKAEVCNLLFLSDLIYFRRFQMTLNASNVCVEIW